VIILSYKNTTAPYVACEEKIWVKMNDTPLYSKKTNDYPVLKTTPLEHTYFKIIIPSCAKPSEQFFVNLLSLDKFENPSSSKFTSIDLRRDDGVCIEKDISFRGMKKIPVSIEQEGYYRFTANGTSSNVIKISREAKGPYWGDIHIHTQLSHDAQGFKPYKYARDVMSLDFGAVADHWQSLGPKGYELTMKWADKYNQPGKFITLYADERNPKPLMGHHNVYFKQKSLFKKYAATSKTGYGKNPQKFLHDLKEIKSGEILIIPHHTGIKFSNYSIGEMGGAIDINAAQNTDCYDRIKNEFRPVMEIYSQHGQSELYCPEHVLAYEFNRLRNFENRGNASVPGPYYAQAYWKQGERLGVIASSDDHSGRGGRFRRGITGLFLEELDRDSIFRAIQNRACYGTTGEKILIEFSIDGHEMGEKIYKKPYEKIHIKIKVFGTDTLIRVELLHYENEEDEELDFIPIFSTYPKAHVMDYEVERDEIFIADSIYYVRVVQYPLERPAMAWSSPIWIKEKK